MFVLDEMSSAILVEGILFFNRERRDMDQVGYYEYSPRFSYEISAFRSVLQLPTLRSCSSLKKTFGILKKVFKIMYASGYSCQDIFEKEIQGKVHF
jgi:hypothetical protein